MGRLQQVTAACGLAACVALGSGCITVHRDADGKLKSVDMKASVGPAALKAPEVPVDPGVKQASAAIPAQATASVASLAKLGKGDVSKATVTEFALTWQPKVGFLPDPSHNGDMIAGMVGQMFLFGPSSKPAQANGKLILEMFDESGRPGLNGTRLGTWTFEKEALLKLATTDEIWGKSYVLFLPWPDYKADIGRVKITGKFEPERGYPLYAPAATVTLDNGTNKSVARSSQTVGAPAGDAGFTGGFMGLPASASAAPRSLPPLDPLPVGAKSATNPSATAPLPANLPPFVITAGSR